MTRTSSGLQFTAPDDDNVAPESGGGAAVDVAQQSVSVRVLPQGGGRIFTGARVDTAIETKDRFPTYERGAVFAVDPGVAAELEARGLVEIQP
jgi:hypothetical protein